MNTNPETYADIVETARKLLNNDCTLTRYGKPLDTTTGYVVGGKCIGWSLDITLARTDPFYYAKQVASWIQAQPSNVEWFGSWTENGRIHFDGVDIVENYLDAILLAFERGEKAIYDIEKGECEYVTEMRVKE